VQFQETQGLAEENALRLQNEDIAEDNIMCLQRRKLANVYANWGGFLGDRIAANESASKGSRPSATK
jgi:hypothetical protein